MPQFVSTQIGKGTVLQAPTADGTTGQFLKTDGAGNLSFATPTASPAGSDTHIQFNDSGAFGGDANFTWSGTELVVGTTSTPAALNIVGPLGTNVTTPVFSSQLFSGGGARGTLAHYRGRALANNTDRSQVCFWPTHQTNDALFNGSNDGFTLSSSYAYGISSGDAESVAADVTLGRGASGGFEATSTVTTAPVFVAKTPASHAAKVIEVQDSTSAVLASFDQTGKLSAFGGIDIRYGAADTNSSLMIDGNLSELRAVNTYSSARIKLINTQQWALEGGGGNEYWCCGTAGGAGANFILGGLALSAQTNPTDSANAFALDCANNTLVLGPTKNATPPASILSGSSGSGTDIAGANLTLAGGAGTGTGAGGSIKFRTAPAGAVSGNALNSAVDVMEVDSTGITVTGSTFTPTATFVPGDALGRTLAFADSTGTLRGGIRQTTTTTTIGSNWENNHAQMELSGSDGYRVRLNTIQGNSYFDQSGTYGATFKHGTSITGRINSDGMYVTGQNTTNPVFQVNLPVSHANNAIEAQDSTGTILFLVNEKGTPWGSANGNTSNCHFGTGITHSPTFGFNVGIGNNISQTNQATVVIGWGASATGGSSVTMGYSASTQGDAGQVAIGRAATANGNGGTAIGGFTDTNGYASTVLGVRSEATAARQFVVGSSSYYINDVYTGNGVTNAAPEDVTYHATGGSGTDIAGANLTIAGGAGTGTGAGGHLIFQTAAAGGTGSSLNSLATILELGDDPSIGFFAATPVAQQAGTGETTGFTAGSGTAVNDDSTFTGNVGTTAYTVSDIVKALKNYGLLTN